MRRVHGSPARSGAGFTMIEVALSLAIIAFGLVAIIGVLSQQLLPKIQGGRVAVYSKPYEIAGLYRDARKQGPWTVDEMVKLAPTLAAVPLNIMG